MTKVTPRCSECDHMQLEGGAQRTAANRYNGGPRRWCYCKHPKAWECFKATGSYAAECFVGYTRPGECEPALKTSPRWCPLREGGQT